MAVKYAIQRYWPPPPQEEKTVIIKEEVEVDRIWSDNEKKMHACNILETPRQGSPEEAGDFIGQTF